MTVERLFSMDDPYSTISFLSLFLQSGVAETPASSISAFNLLLVILLVAANGFFVAAEFALVAVRKSRIEAAAAEGDSSAKKLLEMLNNINGYISATQLGITLFSLALGWFGEPAVAGLIQPAVLWLADVTGLAVMASVPVMKTISIVISFALVTFVLIVFGELAPKTIALEMTEKIAYFTAPVLRVFYKIFYYPIRLLEWSGGRTVRLFGFKADKETISSYTEEEIRNLVRISQESGHLNEEEQRLIDKVFEFSETTVKEAMVPRTEVVAIPETSTFDEIAEAVETHGYSRLPVYRTSMDDMVGFVHSKDLVAFARRPEEFVLADVLHKASYVVDTARLEDVLRQMQTEKFHFGFVVDEHGGIEGIITLDDLLEEIVGEISDEHDEEVNEQIKEQSDGTYLLDGGLAVRDLNRRLEMNLPVSESYTTVAGFLMSEAGQIMSEGETVVFNGHTFRVEQVDKRRISTVRLMETTKQGAEADQLS